MLKVWLPLDGKVENHGLRGISVAGNPASYGSGVTGKCGVFDGNQRIVLPLENDIKQLSVCFWVYPNTPGAWSDIFGIGGAGNRFEVNTGSTYYWFSSGVDLIAGSSVLGNFTNNTWYHISFVVTGEKCLLYVNGTLSKEFEQKNSLSSIMSGNNSISIMSRIDGSCKYKGGICDIRVYDNALSPKEIHEISKGLCCHYPLNDPFPTTSINKYSGDYFEGKPQGGSYTVTKLADERGYNYKLSYTGTGNNNWFSFYFPTFSFTAGKTYDYSCKVRCYSSNFNIYFRAARMSNDWVTTTKNITGTKDGKWHEYHIQLKLEAKSTRSGTEYDTKPLIEFYSDNLSTKDKAFSCNFDVKDIQVSECGCSASVSNGAWNDLTVYDTSGFGNHGSVKNGSIPSIANGSPRYDLCQELQYKQYITGKTPFGANAVSRVTISAWVNQIDGGGYSTYFCCNGYGGRGLWLGANVEGSGQWAYIGSNSPSYTRGGNVTKNTWYLFTYVFNNGVGTWYLNGKKSGSATYTNKTVTFTDIFTLGDSYTGSSWNTNFHGKISDLRIYGTALSEKDILEMYNSPVSVANNGTMILNGEVIEKL